VHAFDTRFRLAVAGLRYTADVHAGLVDAAVSIALTAAALLGIASVHRAAPVAFLCCIACTSAVAWRRQAPVMATLVALAAMVCYVYATDGQALVFQVFAVLLTFYTAGSRCDLPCLAGLLLDGVVGCMLIAAKTGGLTAANVITHGGPITVLPALAGVVVNRHRALTRKLASTTAQLRAERDLRMAAVAEQERNRVARELHDVVVHAVSVMVIQAGAARITVRDEPDTAQAALREVVASGGTALTDLNRIVGLLHSSGNHSADNHGPGAAEEPRQGVAGLPALVERLRAGGLDTQLKVAGDTRPLPADLDLAIYRIVQEALTNVVKHAASAPTQVRLTFAADQLDVQVTNAEPAASSEKMHHDATSGQGLRGMRERVDLHRGTLHHGPLQDGGYQVRACLPLGLPPLVPQPPATAPVRRWLTGMRWPRGPIATAAVTAAVTAALVASAIAGPDRRGSLTVNIVLVTAMSLLLPLRRRVPLLYVIAVNALAIPISNGLTSIDNPTLASTYVFAVPLWAVAVWCPSGIAIAGLLVELAACAGEDLYWHLGVSGFAGTALLAVVVWLVGRIIGSQRELAATLQRTSAQLISEQEERERLAVAAERTNIVASVHSLVAEQVTAMVVYAQATYQLASEDPDAASQAITRIESAGREALTQLRQVLGLLRSDHDPAQLNSQLGQDDVRALVANARASHRLDVTA
jgi:signal transduction histidine kinase